MILKLVNLFIFKGWKLLTLNTLDRIYIDFDNEYIGYQSPACVVNWETPCTVQLLLTEMSEITCICMGVLSSITSANSNPSSVSNVQHFQKKKKKLRYLIVRNLAVV